MLNIGGMVDSVISGIAMAVGVAVECELIIDYEQGDEAEKRFTACALPSDNYSRDESGVIDFEKQVPAVRFSKSKIIDFISVLNAVGEKHLIDKSRLSIKYKNIVYGVVTIEVNATDIVLITLQDYRVQN